MKKTIILERDYTHRDYLRTIVSNDGGQVFCFENEMICLDNLFQLNPDLIVVGSSVQNNVINFINGLKAIECNLPVLLLSQKEGIKRYLKINKFNNIITLNSSLDVEKLTKAAKSAAKVKNKLESSKNIPFFVGVNSEILKIKKILPELSKSKENIIILGEDGTGRELLTRAIHYNSNRSAIFIKIDAKSITDRKAVVHLLDNLKNCFKNRPSGKEIDVGKNSATLYIKEIGYLPPSLQGELLLISKKNLQDKSIVEYVGKPDFRIIATTSQHIESLVKTGSFRKDLFYRLNVLDIFIPPLRRRVEDIPLLIDFFAYKYCKELNRSNFEISPEIRNCLINYQWPGNVKELENTVKRMVLNGNDETLVERFSMVSAKPEFKNALSWLYDGSSIDDMADVEGYLDRIEDMSLKNICWDFMAKIEKKIIKKTLDYTNWNRKKAASVLNISYKSMLNKIKQYGLA